MHQGAWLRILTQDLCEIQISTTLWDINPERVEKCQQAWRLFILLPRLLLHHTARGGEAEEREVKRRVVWYDAGEWDKLHESARKMKRGAALQVPTERKMIPMKKKNLVVHVC